MPNDGIVAKLKRSKENILNLEAEISGFFQEGDYALLPEHNRKLLLKAIEYHKNRPIPLRFGVLAGEIIHHLRSCFDHVVWHFSTGPAQNNMPVEFPVFTEEPVKKNDIARFKGKIQKITNPKVVSLIEGLQPYSTTDPMNDPLGIIHNFDITDKHKKLVLCIGTASRNFPLEMSAVIESYEREHPELDTAQLANHFKAHGAAKPSVSFRNFGRREIESVIPGLTKLHQYTFNVIRQFEVL